MMYPRVQHLGPAYPARSAADSHGPTRELDSRVTDGIQVRLLWHEGDGRVTVAVDDTKTGEAFEVPVRDGDRALEVFHHPYAYAASHPGSQARAQRNPVAPPSPASSRPPQRAWFRMPS
jgi:hypothetical protein